MKKKTKQIKQIEKKQPERVEIHIYIHQQYLTPTFPPTSPICPEIPNPNYPPVITFS